MFYCYIILILLCLIISLINKRVKEKNLWLYFGIVLISESLIHLEILNRRAYDFLNVFYILFFYIYFFSTSINKYFSIIFCSLILFCSVFLIDIRNTIVLFQAFLYILFTMIWFYKQIENVDEIRIYKKMNFWVCVSLLLWSTVYIFRILPAYFFLVEDSSFLHHTLGKIYQMTVIVCYLIFFKGLFCRQ